MKNVFNLLIRRNYKGRRDFPLCSQRPLQQIANLLVSISCVEYATINPRSF
jgi:hypothetical protein